MRHGLGPCRTEEQWPIALRKPTSLSPFHRLNDPPYGECFRGDRGSLGNNDAGDHRANTFPVTQCQGVGSLVQEHVAVDVANTFGAIREAELRHRAKAEVAPTPFPETLHLSEFCDLAQALTERFLIKAASPIDACEALLLAICLEHTHLKSVGEAQNVLVVLSEIMGCDELNGADQIVFENLARCQVAVAKQMGALSVQKGGA